MNILFRGGGFSNKGDEAMMLTARRELAKRMPGINFVLWTSPRSLEEAHTHGLLAYSKSGGPVRRGLRLIRACATDGDVRRAVRIDWVTAETLANVGPVDGIVDFSGFNYSDEWGVACARRGLAWAVYCDRYQKPFICLPQAWGPFRSQDVAEAVRRLCRYSRLVYSRDKVSLLFLKELLGQDSDGLRIAPDIAFLFSGENRDAGRQTLVSIGVNLGTSPIVGIAPNMRVYERCGGVGAANEYVQMLIRVAKHCIHAWDALVVLLPHEFSMRAVAKKDDRFLCGLVQTGVSDTARCFTIRTYLSASLLKAVESQLDFMIGSRFHSCVFALASAVPAVALGWAHKYSELMEIVGLDENALIHTQFDMERIMLMLNKAWERRGESVAVIKKHLLEIRQNVTSTFDDVASAIVKSCHKGTA